MKLFVTAAIGRARTELAAFDHALTLAGVADRNLIPLSSVIPDESVIIETSRIPPELGAACGDRRYAMYAARRTSLPGTQVWAGVGWITEPDTGRGLFVEHDGDDEHTVRDQIATSLQDLRAHRDVQFGAPRWRVIGATCIETPTCALVLCAYAVQAWDPPTRGIDGSRPSRALRFVQR
jgi:arginine decarboxylase